MKTYLVIPDMHVPYHDKKALSLVIKVAKHLKPYGLVNLGDFVDLYTVSRFDKDPRRKFKFADEIKIGNQILDEIDKAVKWKDKIFCEGNHEYRLQKYLFKHPELLDLIKIEDQLQLGRRGYEFVPFREFTKRGKMHYAHEIGRFGKHAAQQSLVDFGHNLTFGHSHRGAVVYGGTVRGDTHVCLNAGWLGDVKHIDYQHKALCRREWQLGFGLIRYDNSGKCYAQFIPIINHSCMVDGKFFKV